MVVNPVQGNPVQGGGLVQPELSLMVLIAAAASDGVKKSQ
jgi:hypothetical protein